MRRLLLQSMIAISGGFLCVSAAQTPQTAQQTKPPVSLSPAMPVIPTPPADPAKMAEPVGGNAPAVVPVDLAKFVLGVEDQISVSMWGEPDLSGSFTIRPDGMISLPLIGEIRAAGYTPMQLQEVINKAALTQLKEPRSTVNVVGVHSKHIFFDGEGIARTGAMDLVIPIHLLEGISAQGGFKEFADKKHIRVLRDGKVFMIVNYKNLIDGKHQDLNVLLQDGDHVIVN